MTTADIAACYDSLNNLQKVPAGEYLQLGAGLATQPVSGTTGLLNITTNASGDVTVACAKKFKIVGTGTIEQLFLDAIEVMIGLSSANVQIGCKSGGTGVFLDTNLVNANIQLKSGSGAIHIGDYDTTGNIYLGGTTATNTVSIANGATSTLNTQTINIGAGTANGVNNVHIADSASGVTSIYIGKYGSSFVVVEIDGDRVRLGTTDNSLAKTEICSGGTARKLSFFGATGASRQTSTGTLADLITILKNYGLIA